MYGVMVVMKNCGSWPAGVDQDQLAILKHLTVGSLWTKANSYSFPPIISSQGVLIVKAWSIICLTFSNTAVS